jgi:hypothetical protein
VVIRTFKARWDRLGLMQDTTVRREPTEPIQRAAADDFRVLGAREMRSGLNGLYWLARIVLAVPVALIFAVEWLASMVVRGVAALVNRGN